MIRLENVCKNFGDLQVLKNVNLEVKEGEKLVIIGPSGSGKSTTVRCMNFLEEPTSGQVYIDGQKLTHANKTKIIRESISMVFQQFNLFPHMTILDNMTLAPMKLLGRPKDEAETEALKLLERVGLKEKASAYPGQLSGGQKQRVAIARALVLNPKILLCDEATSALDPQITKGILALLLKINKELGITIVVVTHQMEVVKEICNKVAFLKHGKMIATGKPEELFVAPNKDVQEFVGDSVEFLPKDGVNVRLFFNDETASDSAITHLAHELGINFGICQGKLENFRGTIMGSLVINVTEADRERVTAWLTDRGILWEVLENV